MTRDIQNTVSPVLTQGQRLGFVGNSDKSSQFDSPVMHVPTVDQADELERLLRIAVELRPLLRERQQETEDAGRYSQEIHEIFWSEGFYKILQPKMFGGLELGVSAFFRVISEIARGCPSTGWCLSLGSGHALQIASYWPESAQRQVFESQGQVVAASSGGGHDLNVVRENDGFRISGTWRYCSGSPYSTHFLPLIPQSGEPPLWMILKRAQFDVLNDWGGIIGMRGSGSNSIRVEDAFVPNDHIIEHRYNLSHSGHTNGSLLHGNPEYAGVFRGFAEGEIAAVAVGLAYASLDEYIDHVSTRKLRGGSTAFKYEHVDFQRALGLAFASADSAAALSTSGGRLYRDNATKSVSGIEDFTTDKALRIASMYFTSEELAWDTVERVMRTLGSSEMLRGKRMERYARDALTIRTRTDQLEFDASSAGQALL